MRSTLASPKGQAVLVLILIVDLVVAAGLAVSVSYGSRQTQARIDETQRFLLSEATSSAFVVMEAALRRRLWEAPPDASCLKSQNFSVSGSTEGGVKWSVTANYNPSTKVYDLTADGQYRAVKARFYKQVKVRDASDYLLLNNGTKEIPVIRSYRSRASAGFVANQRLIYTRGPISFYPHVLRSNVAGETYYGNPGTVNWPVEYPIIMQSERMQIAGGLSYGRDYPVYAPEAPPVLVAQLAPYSSPFGAGNYRYYAQAGGGAAVVTKDYALGLSLQTALQNNDASGLDRTAIRRQVYPIALFADGGHPLLSHSAADSGSFANKVENWDIFYYSYSGNHFGALDNFTCLERFNAATGTTKRCSDSNTWPRGFAAWKTSAGLDQTLFTKETEEIPLTPIDWDNMEALEEDARACGAVVESGSGSTYEDCPIWDTRFLDRFVASGAKPPCQQVSRFNLNAPALANFSSSQLADDALKDRLLRRVVYFKGPAEIAQSTATGLYPSLTPVERQRLTMWLVSEDLVTLRGFQNDTTSPLNSDPGRLREIVFNADGTRPSGSGSSPLRLVVLSPETVHLVSPQYVPLTSSMFTARYAAQGGKLLAKIPPLYDFERNEKDVYTYGNRNYRVENIAYITNSAGSASNGFYLKGLWAGPDSSAEQYIRNQCYFNAPGVVNGTGPGQDETGGYPAPSYAGTTIPPLGSRFYQQPGNIVPSTQYPQVFWTQIAAAANPTEADSHINFSGLRLLVDFDDSPPPSGKRQLAVQKYAPTSYYSMADMPDRNYVWFNKSYYWQPTTRAGKACVAANFKYLDGTPRPSTLDSISVNVGRGDLQHSAPLVDTLRDVGALFGVDLPMVQVKQ
jgi:hypothetical protein